ncbi:MAG: hypothetical protein EBV69_06135 [Oxalobacteraceae bacterium]|nr:hypothetical protein [Oxalobacteraceae bacterium]
MRKCSCASAIAVKAYPDGGANKCSVCRAIVRVHGGRIWIEDNPGGGTCVNVALPIGAPPSLPMSLSEELI